MKGDEKTLIKDYRALHKIARRAACMAVYARFRKGGVCILADTETGSLSLAAHHTPKATVYNVAPYILARCGTVNASGIYAALCDIFNID